MKTIKEKIEENKTELKIIKEKVKANISKQNIIYSSLDEMYDEGDYSLGDLSALQTGKELLFKENKKLGKQETKLIRKLIKLTKKAKIEPDDELIKLLNLN